MEFYSGIGPTCLECLGWKTILDNGLKTTLGRMTLDEIGPAMEVNIGLKTTLDGILPSIDVNI